MTMNEVNNLFKECYEYAKTYSTCNKVYVGACLLYEDGTKVFSANCGEHNCQIDKKCYKFEKTGIYESCEETRKYCAATHAEINLLNKIDKSKSLDGAILFITRYPCGKCMKEVVKAGIKCIYFCGRSEGTSPEENKRLAKENFVTYMHFPDVDFEDDYNKLWWTRQFADKAYDCVKDHRYPIIIPSYNRPNSKPLVKGFLSNMTPDKNYPIYVFVRSSQYDDYVKGLSSNKYVNIVGITDELMIGAGAARRQSLKWMYDRGYEVAFSFDDDLTGISYTEKAYTEKGDPKSKVVKEADPCDVLAMWQLSMEKAIKDHNVMISGVMPQGFSWKAEYCHQSHSMMHYRGLPSQAVCLNVKGLIENNLTYGDNKDVGHEDIDLTIRIIQSGNSVCVFPFLVHSAPLMSVENWDFANMNERFKHQQGIMMKNHSDKDWVKFADKRGFAQVSINWQRVRKEFGIEKYVYNIWNNGSLLNS